MRRAQREDASRVRWQLGLANSQTIQEVRTSQVEAVPICVDAIRHPVSVKGSPILVILQSSVAVNKVTCPWHFPRAGSL